MSQVAKLAEVQAAKVFLKAVGASPSNTDMIYAVIAWMRQESGGLKSTIGNNPFNLRPGKDIDQDLIYGVRKTKNGNGYFLVFKSLKDGLLAAAQRLLRAGHDWRSYDLIIRAARNNQPIDFLNAIALSAWNASHYGYKDGDTMTNHLYQVYAGFTGLQQPKPAEHKAKKKDMPIQPRDLNAPVIVRNYLDPHESERFYAARHRNSNILGD